MNKLAEKNQEKIDKTVKVYLDKNDKSKKINLPKELILRSSNRRIGTLIQNFVKQGYDINII